MAKTNVAKTNADNLSQMTIKQIAHVFMLIEVSEASPYLVFNVAILSVCVCHGPAR